MNTHWKPCTTHITALYPFPGPLTAGLRDHRKNLVNPVGRGDYAGRNYILTSVWPKKDKIRSSLEKGGGSGDGGGRGG